MPFDINMLDMWCIFVMVNNCPRQNSVKHLWCMTAFTKIQRDMLPLATQAAISSTWYVYFISWIIHYLNLVHMSSELHLGNIQGIYMQEKLNHIGLVQCQGRFAVNNNTLLPFPPHKSMNGSILQLLLWYFLELHNHWWLWCIICILYWK